MWRAGEMGALRTVLCRRLGSGFNLACWLSPGDKGESSDEKNDEECEAG